ncbi:ClpP/crotonase [Powellomyces hirtus]|nr:ClpP/crotonase [Powellomyces hirtus]
MSLIRQARPLISRLRPVLLQLSSPTTPYAQMLGRTTACSQPAPPLLFMTRAMSGNSSRGSDGTFVTADIQPSGYAMVAIKREPVNSMDMELWKQLLQTLDACESDAKVRGIVFHSTLAKPIFTAGNDLKELYARTTSKERHREFWSVSNTFLARLLNSPLVTVAAIKGACPAGGACMAMACDFRIATKNSYIGLNEVALGIPVPPKWIKLMVSVVGQGRADKLLQSATLVPAPEALTFGLVDRVVDSEDELIPAAVETVTTALKLPDIGRVATKGCLRGKLSREWKDPEWLEEEHRSAWEMLESPEIVAFMENTLKRLSKPKGKTSNA